MRCLTDRYAACEFIIQISTSFLLLYRDYSFVGADQIARGNEKAANVVCSIQSRALLVFVEG